MVKTTKLHVAPTRLDSEKIGKMANVLKTIAHPLRLSVIEVLDSNGPMTVTELINQLQVEQSLLSHHLTKMKDRGILTAERQGKNIRYELAEEALTRVFDCLGNCDLVK